MLKKRIKIANRVKFISSLSIILITISIIVSSLFALVNGVEGYQEPEYYEVYIDYGDTIWDIAKEFTPKDKDIRKSIYEISQLNNLNTYDIYPGQILKIPIE